MSAAPRHRPPGVLPREYGRSGVLDLPLEFKWMGEETSGICELIAPFHPLILISPTPVLRMAPPGLVSLPGSVSNLWGLRDTAWARPPAPAAAGREGSPEFSFDYIELDYGRQDFSAVYEFYFRVYLRNTALRRWPQSVSYQYIEELHRALFEGKFVAFIRGTHNKEAVAGCLLSRPSEEARRDFSEVLGPGAAGDEAEGVLLDLMCSDVRFEQHEIDELLSFHAARWARDAGYSFLADAPSRALVMNPGRDDPLRACGLKPVPVFHREKTSLLYCDLRRCSYLPHDFYYYTCDGAGRHLHYVINAPRPAPPAARLLDSLEGIAKHVYTRHASIYEALSEAGVACVLVGRGDTPGG